MPLPQLALGELEGRKRQGSIWALAVEFISTKKVYTFSSIRDHTAHDINPAPYGP